MRAVCWGEDCFGGGERGAKNVRATRVGSSAGKSVTCKCAIRSPMLLFSGLLPSRLPSSRDISTLICARDLFTFEEKAVIYEAGSWLQYSLLSITIHPFSLPLLGRVIRPQV